MKRTQIAVVAFACLCAGSASSHECEARAPTITSQSGNVDAPLASRLQAVSPVDEHVVWASGLDGTFVVTTNGGKNWHKGVVEGAETLQFRDVQGVSNRVAYLLAAGPGPASRIYKTVDGGAHWTLQFQAPEDENYFYDCFAFSSPTRGIAMADAIPADDLQSADRGTFPAKRTTDGSTWNPLGLPSPESGEGAFAASGTCVATQGSERAWIVTTSSRVFATHDGGRNWSVSEAPVAGRSPGAGLFSVAFRDAEHGVVAGGNFLQANVVPNVARSHNGGKKWKLTRSPAPIPGAIFGVAYAESARDGDGDDGDDHTIVATGPGGTAWSPDEGDCWNSISGLSGLWAVAFANEHVGWLVGTNGQIVQIKF